MSWDILPKGNLQYFLQKLKARLDLKVDKEVGKGLSTNDFTTTEKNKLAGIEAGAQVNPTIDSALSDSSVNAVQNKVVKAALDGKADSEEVPTVNNNTITIQLNGVTVESFKLNQATDETINIQVTKSSVGLGNVPNVSTDDQTPTFTQASTRANIASGEKLSVIFGKIMKWFADLKTVAFSGSYNDLSNKPTIPAAVAVKGNAESAYRTGNVNITPANIGLGNVNNTADANKSVNYATSAGSAGSAGYANKALVSGENSGAYISVQAEGTTVIDSEHDSHYYFPSCKAVTSYLNSNFTKYVKTAQIDAGGSYTFTGVYGFDCALIITFHPYYPNNYGLYIVSGGYTTSSSAIKAIVSSSDITIVKTSNSEVKITSTNGTFAKMIM